MEAIRLSRTSRVLAGHLWVFSNELMGSPRGYEAGSLVELRDRKGAFLGIGYINPRSLISVRVLTREREEIGKDFFKKRISEALLFRRRFYRKDSFRAVFSESDFLPGLIVDKYGDTLSVQFLTAGIDRLSPLIIDALDEIFSPGAIVLRNDTPARELEGLPMEKTVVKGTLERLPVIREETAVFEVDPLSGQKTGFFLDQAENRAAFSHIAEGAGLDLFCYTGAWAITLARRGANVLAVDSSTEALSMARRNAELNSLAERVAFVKADVFRFLEEEASRGNAYDWIVLDPPAFVKTKARLREGLRGYTKINAAAMRLLKRGGLLATSSCSYHVTRDAFLEVLQRAARDAGKTLRLIEMRSQAKDHPVLVPVPETEYLKCAFLEVT